MWLVGCMPWLTGSRYVGGDSVGVFYPQIVFVASSIRRGDWPWWNPLIMGGQPLLGDPQNLIFSPHTLAGLILGKHLNLSAFDSTTLLCILFGGIAMRAYCCMYTTSRAMPLLGAAVFMFGGPATSRLQHVPEILTYAMLPIILLAIRRLSQKPTLKAALWLCASMMVDLLNPNQVVFLSFFGLLPFSLTHVARAGARLRVVVFTAGAALAALLLASPALAAMIEFLNLSNRPALPLGASTPFSLPAFNLLGLFYPGLYGVMNPKHGVWSPTDTSEDYLYIGMIPVGLAIIGLIQTRRLAWLSVVAVAMGALWLMYTLGTNTPLYGTLFQNIPGFSGFRRPADGTFLANFSLAILVGSASFEVAGGKSRLGPRVAVGMLALGGLAAIAAFRSLRGFAVAQARLGDLAFATDQFILRLGIAAALVTLAWIVRRRQSPLPLYLAASLAILDMLASGRFQTIIAPRTDRSPTALYYAHVRNPDPSVGWIKDELQFLQQKGAGDPRIGVRVEVLGGELGGNLPMTAGVSITQGINPLVLASYIKQIGSQDLQVEGKQFTAEAPGYDGALYRQLGLRYLLLDRAGLNNPGGLGPVGKKAQELRAQLMVSPSWSKRVGYVDSYEVWELTNAAPKAQLVERDGSIGGACVLVTYRNNSVRVRCRPSAGQRLVIGDNFAPGWKACVNGLPAPVLPYQGTFRSVVLAAGEDEITLRYLPIPWLRLPRCD